MRGTLRQVVGTTAVNGMEAVAAIGVPFQQERDRESLKQEKKRPKLNWWRAMGWMSLMKILGNESEMGKTRVMVGGFVKA